MKVTFNISPKHLKYTCFFVFIFSFVTVIHGYPLQIEEHRIKAAHLFKAYQEAENEESKLELLSALVMEIHYSDSAQTYYQEAIALAKKIGHKELLAQNINRLGVYYRNMNLQEEALKMYEEALEVSLESGESIQIGHSLNNIGQMYFYRDYFDEALDYYSQAEQKFLEVNDLNGLGYNYTGVSLVLSELGRYREALEKIDKAIEIRESLNQNRQVIVSRFNKADILMSLGNYAEAEQDIQKLYDYGLEYDKVRAINALEKLVELNIKKGDINQAIRYAQLAENLNQEKPNSESMIEIYQMMNQVYYNRGDTLMSTKYQNLLQAERNNLKAEKTKIYLAGLTIKNQKNEIEFLNRQQTLIQQNERFKAYLLVGLFIGILMISIAYFVVYRSLKKEKNSLKLLSDQKAKIEQQAEELARLNQVKDKIFSILAHDLKGPLNSLSGLVKLIQEDDLTKEEFTSYIPIIAQNLGNNNILLENLLAWSRSQMQGLEVHSTLLRLNDLIQKNIEFLYHSGYYKGQIMINEVDESMIAIGDKNMIEIVVRNLLTNALKFTKQNDQIIVSAFVKHGKITIKVSDEGVGIMRKNLARLFGTEFFTTPGTHQEKGTGIGLILTKELIQINKGKIWVESEYGAGSTFYFTIPKAD
ncbi:Signal transduction histidine kinase [Belliella buryatensis]|uniref:histidine kinase n=1 Tax=Belliella buryatensis TaxID=1500549 RepID=A0A239EN23_9BACT|nr:ATP-binding protein [Belliella buryatensis]SNS45433.1 Signal transduction histidine kinase [Belliella buryatensis]